jgi:hypothetical protein
MQKRKGRSIDDGFANCICSTFFANIFDQNAPFSFFFLEKQSIVVFFTKSLKYRNKFEVGFCDR